MFKFSKIAIEQRTVHIFKVNNKDTRTTSGASIVNFEHIFRCMLLLILLNFNK